MGMLDKWKWETLCKLSVIEMFGFVQSLIIKVTVMIVQWWVSWKARRKVLIIRVQTNVVVETGIFYRRSSSQRWAPHQPTWEASRSFQGECVPVVTEPSPEVFLTNYKNISHFGTDAHASKSLVAVTVDVGILLNKTQKIVPLCRQVIQSQSSEAVVTLKSNIERLHSPRAGCLCARVMVTWHTLYCNSRIFASCMTPQYSL